MGGDHVAAQTQESVMTRRLIRNSLATVMAVGAAAVMLSVNDATAQRGIAPATASAVGATPRTSDGHPDLSGMWGGRGGGGGPKPDEKGNLTGLTKQRPG